MDILNWSPNVTRDSLRYAAAGVPIGPDYAHEPATASTVDSVYNGGKKQKTNILFRGMNPNGECGVHSEMGKSQGRPSDEVFLKKWVAEGAGRIVGWD